jgi:GT2 family glycosyltransferase
MTTLDRAPSASIVIANFNGRHHLELCLPALFATTGADFEVIVADNGSSDGSLEWLRERWPQVRVLPLGANLGFGEANRRGVEAARGEYVAFLNSDTVVDPRWLAELLAALREEPRIAAACSLLRLLDHPELVNARGGSMTRLGYGIDHDFLFPYEGPPEVTGAPRLRDVFFPTAAAMVMRREEFLSLGGFDRSFFMYHEDVDLGWRLWLLGRRVVVCEKSIVFHKFLGTSKTARGLRWRALLGLRHDMRSLIKHYELWNLLLAVRRLLIVLARQGAFLHIAHALGWNLVRLPATLAERFRLQRQRKISDAELFNRGLISRAPVPFPDPEWPVVGDALHAASWVPSPELLPGQPSVVGRLGYGWYARELVEGEVARRICGHARCFLRVRPGDAGLLSVEVQLPADAGQERTVRVRCNGAEATLSIRGGGWQTLSLATRADDRGVLEVHLFSPTFIPHATAHNWDFRRVGCAARAVRFAPDRPWERRRYGLVSVVIPTHNRWPVLKETLEALERQSCRAFEVIVVDDGSTDGTWENLQRFRDAHRGKLDLTVLHQENLKQGRARNLGLRRARGDLVLFLGDDIVPDQGCVQAHVDAHNELADGYAVVGFTDWHRDRVRVTPFLEFVNLDGAQFSFGRLKDDEEAPFTNFYTSNVSVARDLLGEDPFHDVFKSYGWEDIELGWRLTLAGLRIVYRRAASARHIHPMTVRSFWERQLHVGGTIGALLQVCPELAGNPYLPPERPPKRWHLLRYLIPMTIPAIAALDDMGLRLPWVVYREIVTCAFYLGKARSEAGS